MNLPEIHIDSEMEYTEFLDQYQKIETFNRKWKELKKELDAEVVEWVKANGSIEIGESVLSVGKTKSVKCHSNFNTLMELITFLEGDIDKAREIMSASKSSWFKAAEFKKVLGEELYNKHFEESFSEKPTLKKTPKKLRGNMPERTEPIWVPIKLWEKESKDGGKFFYGFMGDIPIYLNKSKNKDFWYGTLNKSACEQKWAGEDKKDASEESSSEDTW